MNLSLKPMTAAAANEIQSWRYPAPYDFYDLDADPEDLEEFLDESNWPGAYFAAFDPPDELVGWFTFNPEVGDRRCAAVGLGMRPDLTGQGLGVRFVESGLDFGRSELSIDSFRLAVASFNKRAIEVYRRLQFQPTEEFQQRTNGGAHTFLRMLRPAVRKGASVLLVGADGRVAMQLRDNKPHVGGADCWGLFGGMLEPGEKATDGLVREMQEELEIHLDRCRLSLVRVFLTPTHILSHLFHYGLEDDLRHARLHEGQRWTMAKRLDMNDGRLQGKKVVPHHLTLLQEFWDGEYHDALSSV